MVVHEKKWTKLQDVTNRKGQFHASGLCFQEPHHSDTKSVILRNKLVITYSFLEHTGFQLNHGLSHVRICNQVIKYLAWWMIPCYSVVKQLTV